MLLLGEKLRLNVLIIFFYVPVDCQNPFFNEEGVGIATLNKVMTNAIPRVKRLRILRCPRLDMIWESSLPSSKRQEVLAYRKEAYRYDIVVVARAAFVFMRRRTKHL